MKLLARITSLAAYRAHLQEAVEAERDIYRRDTLEQQLHECVCAVEHAITGYDDNGQVWYNPFSPVDDTNSLVLGG